MCLTEEGFLVNPVRFHEDQKTNSVIFGAVRFGCKPNLPAWGKSGLPKTEPTGPGSEAVVFLKLTHNDSMSENGDKRGW